MKVKVNRDEDGGKGVSKREMGDSTIPTSHCLREN